MSDPISVGDIIVRARDDLEGVVVALGDERQPWWERPHGARNRTKIQVRWLPCGTTQWIARATEGKYWSRRV